jgi:glycerol kinase
VVQWLRDGLHAIRSSAEVEALTQSVPDSGGVMMAPAFTGLGAAWLAGLSSGVCRNRDELSSPWRAERTFLPTLSSERAAGLMAQWEHAVRQAVQP